MTAPAERVIVPGVRIAANRAERRAGRRVTARDRAEAELAGYVAAGRGVDYTKPGACPYQDRPRIDAWSRGYAKRREEGTRG